MNATQREATPADQTFLEHLFAALHRYEFAPLGLPEPQLQAFLAMQSRAQRLGYQRDFPAAVDRILLSPTTGEPIGRILVEHTAHSIHLLDLALLPSAQGQGIGTALLEDLIAQSVEAKLPLKLSVRPGNRALELYRRMGFQVVAQGVHLVMERNPEPKAAPAATPAPLPETPRTALRAEALSVEAFVPFLGTYFDIADPQPTRLKLVDVAPLGVPGGGSFLLLFVGPPHPVLPQAIYDLRSQEETEAQPALGIFLVPLGSESKDPHRGMMRYEAIFNR